MTGASALLPDVRHIAVLRPNAVGDFVFALPCLHALKAAYPEARITYLGKPWHADFLAGRPGPVDEVVVVPPCPGVGAPPDAPPSDAARRFLDAMRDARFDLALQVYGGGGHSNPLVRQFGARTTIGLRAHDAPPLDRSVRYSELQNRRLQLLEVAALAGADRLPLGQELYVTERDRTEAKREVPETSGRPLVVIQPGATDARRRWPAERFAAVADALAQRGAAVAVNGTQEEGSVVRAVLERMREPAIDL
ncbi:MAG: glycosyltransferase family 9 protein, partial [Burkholderiaceae bacterium]